MTWVEGQVMLPSQYELTWLRGGGWKLPIMKKLAEGRVTRTSKHRKWIFYEGKIKIKTRNGGEDRQTDKLFNVICELLQQKDRHVVS